MKHEITLVSSTGARTVTQDYDDPLEVGATIVWPPNGNGINFRIVHVVDGDDVLYCRAILVPLPLNAA